MTLTATFAGPPTDNPIVVENRQPGSTGWQLGPAVASDSSKQIKGYASATSVAQGETLALYVTVNPAQSYTIDFYRIGWYAGLGGRLMLHAGPLNGIRQPGCPTNATTGLIACAWSPGYTLTVPNSWTSGVYLAVLTNSRGYQNYVVFTVRDDRPAALLYQQSVTTYQAYNNYPNDGSTGKSLYTYNSFGATTVAGDPRAVKVSFDRPYADQGAGHFLHWEINFIRWLERQGYDVTYSTDVDTHASGARLLQHRAFISVGHDEYWSRPMFDAAVAARDAGVNLGFFGADAAYWQIRFEASASGVPNRIVVCYKDASIDPVQGPTTTVRWRDAPVSRPEQTLVGVQYTGEVTWSNLTDYVVINSSHPLYAGTGFSNGDRVTGILGYEMDRYMPEYPAPPSTSRTLLSSSPFVSIDDGLSYQANSSIYQAPSGAWVFGAGTIAWGWALDDLEMNLSDPRIQRMTANILNLFTAPP